SLTVRGFAWLKPRPSPRLPHAVGRLIAYQTAAAAHRHRCTSCEYLDNGGTKRRLRAARMTQSDVVRSLRPCPSSLLYSSSLPHAPANRRGPRARAPTRPTTPISVRRS